MAECFCDHISLAMMPALNLAGGVEQQIDR